MHGGLPKCPSCLT
jgi:hypothetical protein